MSGSCPVGAEVCREAHAEVERLHSWAGLMESLDEHWPEDIFPTTEDRAGRDAGPRIVSLLRWVERLTRERDGERRALDNACGRVLALIRERDAARAEVERLRALGDRLAATVDLLLHDAHPVYGSTATWHGGIGGQALTPGCFIIDGPPGSEWAQYDLPSDSLREWVVERGMDAQGLDAAKDRERAHLLALLNPTGGEN